MAFSRTCIAATLAAALAAGGRALADAPPWAQAEHSHGHPPAARFVALPVAHGVLAGTIAGVDYGSASILVSTPRGLVPVAVTPTTSIFRGAAFASFADLTRGARVTIDFSVVAGRLVAQIIRIR